MSCLISSIKLLICEVWPRKVGRFGQTRMRVVIPHTPNAPQMWPTMF